MAGTRLKRYDEEMSNAATEGAKEKARQEIDKVAYDLYGLSQ